MKTKIYNLILRVLRGIFNACWKLAVIAASVCIVCAIFNEYGLGYARICRFLAPKWEYANTLSDRVYVQQHKKGYYKLFDRRTGRKISNTRFRMVYDAPERDSLTVFRSMDGRRGFLNVNTGRIAIPAQYRHAWVFSEGVAAVVGDDDSLRFIGYDGKAVFDRAFEYDANYDYVFRDGLCIMTRETEVRKLEGMIDLTGNWIIPQEYTSVIPVDGEDWYFVCIDNSDYGYKEGLIDISGNWIFPPVYNNIDYCRCDSTFYLTKDYVKSHISADGTVLEPFLIEEVYHLSYDLPGENLIDKYDYEYTRVAISDKVASYRVCNLYGLLDLRTGKPLTPACFSDISMQTADLIRCQLKDTYSEVLYDSNGRGIQ